jgi:hypothetical protein
MRLSKSWAPDQFRAEGIPKGIPGQLLTLNLNLIQVNNLDEREFPPDWTSNPQVARSNRAGRAPSFSDPGTGLSKGNP